MKEWERQEKEVAKRRRAQRTPGSGSSWRKRNDLREEGVLWECKQTSGVSITLKRSDWLNLRTNALLTGKMPAMSIRIGNTTLVVIGEDDFDEKWPVTE